MRRLIPGIGRHTRKAGTLVAFALAVFAATLPAAAEDASRDPAETGAARAERIMHRIEARMRTARAGEDRGRLALLVLAQEATPEEREEVTRRMVERYALPRRMQKKLLRISRKSPEKFVERFIAVLDKPDMPGAGTDIAGGDGGPPAPGGGEGAGFCVTCTDWGCWTYDSFYRPTHCIEVGSWYWGAAWACVWNGIMLGQHAGLKFHDHCRHGTQCY